MRQSCVSPRSLCSRLLTFASWRPQTELTLQPFAWFRFGITGGVYVRPLRTSLTLQPFASKFPAAAYTRRFVSTLRGRGSGRSMRPLGVHMRPLGVYMRSLGMHIRPLGLVSWPAGGAYAPIGGVYPSTGGVYPANGFGCSRKACGRGFPFSVPQGV